MEEEVPVLLIIYWQGYKAADQRVKEIRRGPLQPIADIASTLHPPYKAMKFC